MDPLAHLFLPLLVAYAIRPNWFARRWRFGLAGFALVPDVDKLVGMQGLGHSLVTIVPLSLLLILAGRYLGDDDANSYALLAVAFLGSHLILDIVDGGPAPMLFPFVRQGAGLIYPATLVFGEGALGVTVRGPLVALQVGAPSTGYGTFGFVSAAGVASGLAFLVAYIGRQVTAGGPGDR